MARSKRIWLSKQSLKRLFNDAFRWFPKETGGVLVGYTALNKDLVITDLFCAGPLAEHHASYYIPDYLHDQKKVEQVYFETGGTEVYLGDWHTHPYSNALLSKTDRQTLIAISNYAEARIKEPVMLILGIDPFEMGIWQLDGYSNLKRIFKMKRIIIY